MLKIFKNSFMFANVLNWQKRFRLGTTVGKTKSGRACVIGTCLKACHSWCSYVSWTWLGFSRNGRKIWTIAKWDFFRVAWAHNSVRSIFSRSHFEIRKFWQRKSFLPVPNHLWVTHSTDGSKGGHAYWWRSKIFCFLVWQLI